MQVDIFNPPDEVWSRHGSPMPDDIPCNESIWALHCLAKEHGAECLPPQFEYHDKQDEIRSPFTGKGKSLIPPRFAYELATARLLDWLAKDGRAVQVARLEREGLNVWSVALIRTGCDKDPFVAYAKSKMEAMVKVAIGVEDEKAPARE